MSQKAIRAALEERLAAWAAARAPALRVAWENAQFAPQASEVFLRAFVLPASTTSETLDGAHRAFRGVFQVSIVAPVNRGPGVAAGIADEIAALFPNNLRIAGAGVTVHVTAPASVAPALIDESLYTVPVSIPYRADVV